MSAPSFSIPPDSSFTTRMLRHPYPRPSMGTTTKSQQSNRASKKNANGISSENESNGVLLPPTSGSPTPSSWAIMNTIRVILRSDEQQDIITQFERETGYDFDTRLLREAMGITYLTPYQIKAIFHFTNFNYIVTPAEAGSPSSPRISPFGRFS